MSLSAYELSAGLFARGLTGLKTVLKKGEAHAAVSGRASAELIEAQLAADMNDLAAQVHWAEAGAKLAIARLLGAEPVVSPNNAKSFADFQQRIDTTIAYLSSLAAQDLEAALERVIDIEHRGRSKRFTGSQFLVEFAIPSFFFHLTTAYAILRHQGVELTKGDLMGGWG
ncbi:MAG TPA: DUF1993 domain-containing protein [Polyangiaceae bacterium]|jgi:hypothetical protein